MRNEHSKVICRLFKEALLTSRDWVPERQYLRLYHMAIRKAFDARKHEQDKSRISELLAATRNLLDHWRHETPIAYPASPNGGMVEGRNPEFSQEALEYGHRLVWGANWKEEMQKYETSLLHDKSQVYHNTIPPAFEERQKLNKPQGN